MTQVNEALKLLEKMVNIPSIGGNEKAMADFLEEYTRSLGMEVERQIVEVGRDNIIARSQIGNGGKTVLLNSHMDVVPPGDGWDSDPFILTYKEDRAYGRGATDAKGCMTALIVAMKRIIENPGNLNGNIIFTAVCDEETFSKGARALVERDDIFADYGIIGEPTNCQIGNCHNGSIRPVIEIKGKTAHSSTPELGISSVRIIAYISKLVDEMQENLSEIKHESGGSPSITITLVKAGVKENVLPDWAELVIDRRMVPGEDERSIIESLKMLCKNAEKAFPGASVKIASYLVTTGPASESGLDSEIVKKAYKAYESLYGIQQEPYGLSCNTDMNHFMRKGIPCVIIGPETINICHKANEYIRYSQLEKACLLDEAVIRELLK